MRRHHERVRALARQALRAGAALARERDLLWLLGSVALGAGVMTWALGPESGPGGFVYSLLVDEVVADRGAHRDRDLRVEGRLERGSLCYRGDAERVSWEMVLLGDAHRLEVRFPHAVVPDALDDRDELRVVVQGRLGAKDVFVADQVIPRCPSKYEWRPETDRDYTRLPPRRRCGATSAEDADAS